MTRTAAPARWTAIVLAGGRGRRLGGADKAALSIDGTASLDHVLADLPRSVPVIVTATARATIRPVSFRLEDPPDGGPVAGVAAALTEVATPIVALLATDMPWAGPLVSRLVAEFDVEDADALVPVDASGRRQPLCCVVAADALRAAIDRLGSARGQSMTALMAELSVKERRLDEQSCRLVEDIDTPADLTRARRDEAARRVASGATTASEGGQAMDEWINAVRIELDLDAAVDVDVILDVARIAAHNVERPAAPVTTFLLGIAVAGGADAASAAKKIEALAEGWTRPE
jgi:molybdopterin-guanine dinucleotide biosynthesis protein A